MKYPNDYEPTRWGVCLEPDCENENGSSCIVTDHHILKQDKTFKKAYPEFIHRRDNLKKSICNSCHVKAKNQTEIEFCQERKIKPRTKNGIDIWNRMGGWEIE